MFTSSSTDPVQARRDRITLITLAFFFGAVMAVLVAVLILVGQDNQWQYYGLSADAVFLGAIISTAFQLTRRGNYRWAAATIIGGLGIAVVVLLALFAGLGVLISLTIVFMGMFFSVQLLSGRDLNWGLAGSLGIGFVGALSDAFLKQYQLDVTAIQNLYAVVVAIVVVSFIAFLLRQFGDYSIPAKLSVTYLLVALLPVSALVYYFTTNTQQALETAANAALQGASVEVANNIDTFLEENLNTVKIQALNPILIQYLSLPADERQLDEEGRTEKEVIQTLESYSRRDSINITSYALLDLSGIDVVDTSVTEVGTSKADRSYFKAVFETGLPYVSPAEYSLLTGDYSIYFSAPVRNEAGKIIGVLRARYKAGVIQQHLAQTNDLVGQDSYAVLFDENFLRLAQGNRPELIGKTWITLDPETFARLQEERRVPSDINAENISTNQPDFQAGIESGESLFQAYSIAAASTVIYAVTQLENQTWAMVYAQSLKNLYAPVSAAATNASLVSLVITALVVALAFVITNQISRPIAALTNAAHHMAEGGVNVQAKVDTNDELGQLADAFNFMTANIQANLRELDERAKAISISTEVSRRLSTFLDQDQLVREVVDQIQQAFNYYHAHIYFWDAKRENLVMAGGTGEAGRIMLASGHSIPAERGLVGRAAETGTVVLVSDVSQTIGWLPNPLLPETKSEVAVPIILGETVLGVLDVQHNLEGGLTQTDADLLLSIANQVAIALQNARTLAQAQRQADREARRNEIVQKIHSTTSIEEALKVTVREIGRATNVSQASVRLHTEN